MKRKERDYYNSLLYHKYISEYEDKITDIVKLYKKDHIIEEEPYECFEYGKKIIKDLEYINQVFNDGNPITTDIENLKHEKVYKLAIFYGIIYLYMMYHRYKSNLIFKIVMKVILKIEYNRYKKLE